MKQTQLSPSGELMIDHHGNIQLTDEMILHPGVSVPREVEADLLPNGVLILCACGRTEGNTIRLLRAQETSNAR